MRTTLKIASLSAGLAALLVAVVDLPKAAATVPTGKAIHERLPADAASTVRVTPLAPAIRTIPSEDALRDRAAVRCAKAVWPAVPDECLANGAPARAVRTIAIERREAPATVTPARAPALRAQR